MAAIYGHGWRNAYKSDEFLQFSKHEWANALQGFEEQTIQKAILVCRENYRFAPSMPEFIECCKNVRKRSSAYYQKEPIEPATPDIAEANLQQMRTILNIKQHYTENPHAHPRKTPRRRNFN